MSDKKIFEFMKSSDAEKFSVKHSLTPEAINAIISKTALEAEKDPNVKTKMDQFVSHFGDYWTGGMANRQFMKEFIKDHKPFLDYTFGYKSEGEFYDFWEPKLGRIVEAYNQPLKVKEENAVRDSVIYEKSLKGTGLDYPDLHDYFLYSKNYRGPRKRRGQRYMPYSEYKLMEDN